MLDLMEHLNIDMALEELDLTEDEWEALTEREQLDWLEAQHKEIRAGLSKLNMTVMELEEHICEAKEDVERLEPTEEILRIGIEKLRLKMGVDPCPGQLPIEFKNLWK